MVRQFCVGVIHAHLGGLVLIRCAEFGKEKQELLSSMITPFNIHVEHPLLISNTDLSDKEIEDKVTRLVKESL